MSKKETVKKEKTEKVEKAEKKTTTKSAAKSSTKTAAKTSKKKAEKENKGLVDKVKKALGDRVKEVKSSTRLSDVAAVVVTKDQVDKKAVEKKKKEIEAVKNAVDNPVDVKDVEQLKASLTAMLVKPIIEGPDGMDARVQRTINFYRGYLSIQANKIENEDEKKAKRDALKNVSTVELLNEISEIVGSCPFSVHGGGYMLRKQLAQTGDPVDAFCLYRRTAASVKNGSTDDQTVADIVRTLIIWSCKGRISDIQENIKTIERQIKKNEELAKSNDATVAKVAKAALKKYKDDNEIEGKYKPEIAQFEKFIEETANPSFDIVNGLVDNYNAEDEESEVFKLSRRMVGTIMKTYYPEINIKDADEASMLYNCQQRAGVILNMFRPAVDQNQAYSIINIGEIALAEKKE